MPNSGPDDSIMAGLQNLQNLQVILPITQTLCPGSNLRHSLCLSYLVSLSSMTMSELISCLEGGKMYIKIQRSLLRVIFIKNIHPASN